MGVFKEIPKLNIQSATSCVIQCDSSSPRPPAVPSPRRPATRSRGSQQHCSSASSAQEEEWTPCDPPRPTVMQRACTGCSRSLPNCFPGSRLGGILRRVGWRAWGKAWGFLEAPVEAMGKTSPDSHCLPQRLSRVLGQEAKQSACV